MVLTKTEPKPKQKKYTSKKGSKGKKVFAIAAAAAIAVGANGLYSEYKDSKNTISLSQSLSSGRTLESLGINEDIANKLYKLEGKAGREDLTDQEIDDLIQGIVNLELDVVKYKTAYALNNSNVIDETIEKSDITVRPNDKNGSTRIIIGDVGEYSKVNWNGRTISGEIANYIEEISDMQGVQDRLSKGELDEDEIREACINSLKKTSKFAAGEVKIDDNGNITFETQRVSDYKKTKEQAKKEKQAEQENEGYEIGD